KSTWSAHVDALSEPLLWSDPALMMTRPITVSRAQGCSGMVKATLSTLMGVEFAKQKDHLPPKKRKARAQDQRSEGKRLQNWAGSREAEETRNLLGVCEN